MKKFKNVYIEITKACNLHCPFCPSQNVSSKDYISFDNFKRIIDEIKDYTEGIYLHILGEPLLHQEVFKFIEYASTYLKVSLTTNGRLISKYSNELINSHLYVLNISMQSLINEKYSYIDEYLTSIKYLLDHKKTSMAVHLRLWNDQDINRELNSYIGKYFKEILIERYKNVNISVAKEFKWPSIDDELNRNSCSCLGGKNQMGILVNGDVTICCLDYLGHTKIGNIYESSFKNIIKSVEFDYVLSGWKHHQPYFLLCQKCTFRNRFERKKYNESQNH